MRNAEAYKDSRFVQIGELPSRYHPYTEKYLEHPFSEIYVRRFGIDELMLLSKAVQLKDKSHLIRAIDMVISVDVNDLTVPDLYYVMMWLRSYSYPDSPYVVTWPCEASLLTNEAGVYIPLANTKSEFFVEVDSIASVEAPVDGQMIYDKTTEIAYVVVASKLVPYTWQPCSTENTEIVNAKTVSLTMLDEQIEQLDACFDWPRVRNMVEIEEALKNPELSLLIPQLQWFKGQTLKDKIAFGRAMTDLSAFDKAGKLTKAYNHGVHETMRLKCRKCGSAHIVPIEVDILNFFQ